jgi:phosphate starvation-inducible PhoH-like protein
MKEPNRERKGEIKYSISLDEHQKEAKRLVIENQITIITGGAGSGKSLVSANVALDFLNKKQLDAIFVTRAAIETGQSLGYLPGGLDEKFDPYLEAFTENLYKCMDKVKIDNIIKDGKIKAMPVQFIRGKTVDDILIVEEAQNLTPHEMLAILTRIGKTGKIVINGDPAQRDTRESFTGLDYAIELSKGVTKVKWIKLKGQHRSDLVSEILEWDQNRYKK